MTEPTLERGQTWEQFAVDRITEKSSVELALAVDPPWHEREQLKENLAQLRFDVGIAMSRIKSEEKEISW